MTDLKDIRVEVVRTTPWADALDRARNTERKPPLHKEPSSEWKRKLIDCEHSPIRAVHYTIHLRNIPSWVSVHFARHKYGCEHYVSTQRTDRTGVSRDEMPQNAKVDHDIETNAQEILNISRRRLCATASPETRFVWQTVVDTLYRIGEKELADACVPMCEYRGGRCHELKSCGRCPHA